MDLNETEHMDIADQIKDALIDVATRYGDVVADFDPASVHVLGATAATVLAASDEEHMRADLAALMVSAFMAGRIHAEKHACPLPESAPAGDLFVPTDWA